MFEPGKKLNRKLLKLGLLTIALVLVWFGLKLGASDTKAAFGVNQQINYQGKLNTAGGTQVSNADWNFRFRIYDAASAGTLLWTERWTATTTPVTTINGVFSVALGSLGQTDLLSSLNWNSDSLYLQVDLDADGNGSFEESFSTRKRLTSSPYAFNADQIDGLHATSTEAIANYLIALDADKVLNLYDGGVSSTIATTTWLYVRNDAQIEGNATTTKNLTVLGDTFTLLNGNATTSGHLIVGTTNPTWDLGVGDAYFGGSASSTSLYANADITALGFATTTGGLFTQGNSHIGGTLTADGNVGIGTNLPAEALDVYGNIQVNAGSAYKYNSINLAYASTTLNNYFFGKSGNLTMTGSFNTANGYGALLVNTAGGWNTANGGSTLQSNTIGSNNTANGYYSLRSNTEGSSNTAGGDNSLVGNTTGNNNTAFGRSALGSNITGSNNVALGYFAGTYELGSNTLYIDNQDRISTAGEKTNALLYGTFAATTAEQELNINASTTVSQSLIIGGNATTSGHLIVGTTNPAGFDPGVGDAFFGGSASTTGSFAIGRMDTGGATANVVTGAGNLIMQTSSLRKYKTDINYEAVDPTWIYSLQPATYTWTSTGQHFIGFIAEDVATVEPRFAAYNKEGNVINVEWNAITASLVSAVKNQHQQILDLTSRVDIMTATTSEPLVVVDNPDLDVQTLAVRQAATFYGTIYVYGEAGFMHKVVFDQDIEVKGKIYASADQAGTVTIPANATSTEVTFSSEYEVAPKISVTAQNKLNNSEYWISEKTKGGFRINIDPSLDQDIAFDWIALAVKDESQPIVKGCLDQNALNYNASANQDDGSCLPAGASAEAGQYPLVAILGCTDQTATNYNISATQDDGSCLLAKPPTPPDELVVIAGCTNQAATNYNPDATQDDGSCQLPQAEAPALPADNQVSQNPDSGAGGGEL